MFSLFFLRAATVWYAPYRSMTGRNCCNLYAGKHNAPNFAAGRVRLRGCCRPGVGLVQSGGANRGASRGSDGLVSRADSHLVLHPLVMGGGGALGIAQGLNSELMIQTTNNTYSMTSDIDDIYSYWQITMGKNRSKMDSARRKAIAGRLADGYSAQDLKDAIQGCAWSRFHCGENERQRKYQDIALICRDAYHVDQFIDVFESESRKRATVEKYRDIALIKLAPNPGGMQKLKAIIGGNGER